MTAKCVVGHADLSRQIGVPVNHNTGQSRHGKGKGNDICLGKFQWVVRERGKGRF